MSEPQIKTSPNSQKAHRRPIKKPHHGGQNSRSVVSDNDAYTTLAEQNEGIGEGKSRPRRKSHAVKKGYGQNDTAAFSDGSTQRHTTQHAKTQATPIKQQAYAGPTFHQSPAASALPLPSFYSKSLPNASPLKTGGDANQGSRKPPTDTDHAGIPPLPTETKRESTPLDFLFDAARKASATPGNESPNHRQYLSSAANTPMSRSPAAREGDADFPFELDSGDQGWEAGSNLSTPYKERIEAARSQRTPSAGGKSLNEDERKAKSAALKSFLMNSAQNQTAVSDSNPFNARPVSSQHRSHQHRSNPSTPYNMSGQGQQHQYFPPMPPVPHAAHFQSPSRSGQSNLRNVYQPNVDPATSKTEAASAGEQPRISTARDQNNARSNFADIYNTTNKSGSQSSTHRATPSAQQLEDDLRKFLKLDLISSG